jgi:hypothetical protein
MKKILADPTAPKQKMNGEWPWSYKAPSKDHATSGCLSAGNHYGIGHRTPVGKMSASGVQSGPIPQEAKAFSPDEIFYGEDKKG